MTSVPSDCSKHISHCSLDDNGCMTFYQTFEIKEFDRFDISCNSDVVQANF